MKRQNSTHRFRILATTFVSLLFVASFALFARPASAISVTTAGQSYVASGKSDCNEAKLTSSNCDIVKYLVIFIDALSALVGIVIVGSIIVGGIQYTTAADDPQAITKAKSRIYNAIFALIAFIFFFSLLQWLVPGGII